MGDEPVASSVRRSRVTCVAKARAGPCSASSVRAWGVFSWFTVSRYPRQRGSGVRAVSLPHPTSGRFRRRRSGMRSAQYSGIGAAGFGASGMSVMSASVVKIIAAIDAAFSTADRVTFAGSMMPAVTMSLYAPSSTS